MTPPSAEPLHPSARELPARAGGLASYPPVERWDDWEEYDATAWPRKVKRRYSLIPTICFDCEAACGLLAYDRDTGRGNEENPRPAMVTCFVRSSSRARIGDATSTRATTSAAFITTVWARLSVEQLNHPARRI